MVEAPTHIRLYGTAPDSIVDGPGLRYAIFVQGCSHGCPGCHNPESHPFDGGTLTSIDALMDDIRSNGLIHDVTLSGGDPFECPEASAEVARRLKAEGYGLWAYTGYLFEDLLRRAGMSLDNHGTTGDEGTNSGACDQGADAPDRDADKTGVGDQSTGACDQGAHGEGPGQDADGQGVTADPHAEAIRSLLETVDVLVDGPFIIGRKSLGLEWRGSDNQRLIDVPASRRSGRVMLWHSTTFTLEKPANW